MTVPGNSERPLAGGALGRRRLCGVAALALAVAVLAAASGAVAAQDQPGDPVSIYGDAEDELGNAAGAGTTIYAVVDGEVEDTITADQNGQFGGDGAFAEKLVVNDNAGSTVVFAVETPDGTVALDSVDLGTAGEVVEVSLTFPGGTFAEIDVNGDGNLAKDTTGNGLLNDVDGDGSFDIFDVQTLFNELGSDRVQSNPAAFNFNGDEDPGGVTIFDVQGLFNRLD
jgi:hypothetical protein